MKKKLGSGVNLKFITLCDILKEKLVGNEGYVDRKESWSFSFDLKSSRLKVSWKRIHVFA